MYRVEKPQVIFTTNGPKINTYPRVAAEFRLADLDLHIVAIVGEDVICTIDTLPESESDLSKLYINYLGTEGQTNIDYVF